MKKLMLLVMLVSLAGCDRRPRNPLQPQSAPATGANEPVTTAAATATPVDTGGARSTDVQWYVARLRDLPRVALAQAVVQVPASHQRKLTTAVTGVLGRPGRDAPWPTVGMRLRDCQPLYEFIGDTPLGSTVSRRQASERRRCADINRRERTAPPARYRPENGRVQRFLAPCGGWVLQAPRHVGERLSAGTSLLTLGCDGHLVVVVEKDTTLKFSPADVTSAWILRHGDGPPQQLTERIGAKLRWRLHADDPLAVPGTSTQIALFVGHGRAALAVPTDALEIGEARAFIYVREGATGVKRQAVQLGDTNPVLTEVISGLAVGDEVLLRGHAELGIARSPTAQ